MMVRHVIAGDFKRTYMGAMAIQSLDELPVPWERRLAVSAGREELTIDIGPDGIAVFSPDDRYRYLLTRVWDRVSPQRVAVWIMCNPSTANAFVLDPTIRRCVTFSKREGCTGLIVVNMFAYRSTQPEALFEVADPFQHDGHRRKMNARAIGSALCESHVAIAAWGAFHRRLSTGDDPARSIREIARKEGKPLHTLRRTKDGDPGHPLYVPADTPLVRFEPDVYFTTEAV